jgi:hypothetical protein
MNDELKVSGRDHGLTDVLRFPENETPVPTRQEAGCSPPFYRTIFQEPVTTAYPEPARSP